MEIVNKQIDCNGTRIHAIGGICLCAELWQKSRKQKSQSSKNN